MDRAAGIGCLSLGILAASCSGAFAKDIHHYVFFSMDRERISDPAFLETAAFEGAQLKFTWRELEPAPGRYDFSKIEKDLEFLHSKGKRLFIQLQDATFDPVRKAVPRYLLQEAKYNGGAAPEYSDAETVPQGWVARRWDPAVRERFHELLLALGRRFDGRIAGINLPETAVEFGESGKRYPEGFTPEKYKDAVILNMRALKRAFPRSVTIQYANFMPGEWMPEHDHSYLRSVYRAAKGMGVGVGGPDLLPYKRGQMAHSYRLIAAIAGAVPVGIAVQDGNYEHVAAKTKRRVNIADLMDFARGFLKADYIFWCTQEPYYSRDLVPFLKKVRAGRGTSPAFPAN